MVSAAEANILQQKSFGRVTGPTETKCVVICILTQCDLVHD